MSEMEYGSDEHLDGLSRDALKAEVRWWHGRALEMEAENAKLRELVRELYDELDAATQYDAGGGRGVVYEFADRMRELGVEV